MRKGQAHFSPREIDPETHPRSARERYEPVIERGIFQPALGTEFVRGGEEGRVEEDKAVAAGDDRLHGAMSAIDRIFVLFFKKKKFFFFWAVLGPT